MSNPLLDRYPHPGKFEGEINLTEKLYDLSMDSGQDEELGDCETTGHYMLFRALDKDTSLGDLEGIVAAILHTSSQGFVSAAWYESDEEACKAWSQVETDVSEAEDGPEFE